MKTRENIYKEMEKRNIDLMSIESNMRKCKCAFCNHTLLAGEGFPLVANHGVAYACERCATVPMYRYHGNSHDEIVTTIKKGRIESVTVGIEIETECFNFDTLTHAEALTCMYRLTKHFYTASESDGSLSRGAEFPSAILSGLEKPVAVLNGLDRIPCYKNPTVSLLNALCYRNTCGAHIHAYCSNIETVRRYYIPIFRRFYTYIENDLSINKRVAVFGRDFSHYANRFNGDVLERYNAINVTNSATIEFRLPRIYSANQYIKLMYYWRKIAFLLQDVTDRDSAVTVGKKILEETKMLCEQ